MMISTTTKNTKTNNNIIQYVCNGKIKSIPIEKVDQKHFPPRPEGINFAETPETMQHIYSHISRSLQNECEEKARPQRESEERRHREEVEQLQRKQREIQSAKKVRLQSLPILEQLGRLTRLLQGHTREQKICQFCHNLNQYNHSFVGDATDIIRNIRRQYENEQQQKD